MSDDKKNEMTLFTEDEIEQQIHYRSYVPNPFIVAALPARPVKNLPFIRKYNAFTLTLSGIGQVPNGKFGRLLLTILTTHAVLTKNSGEDKVWINYRTLTELTNELQLPRSRGKEIKEQLDYFAKSTFIFEERRTAQVQKMLMKSLFNENEDLTGTVKATKVSTGIIPFLSEIHYIEIEDKTKKEPYALSICLSTEFTNYSREHSVPIDYTIYKDISSPIGKDIYAWLMYRMNGLKDTVFIPASSMVEQFMPVREDAARNQEWNNFDYIKGQLKIIKDKYCPYLNIDLSSTNDGFYLHRSVIPKLTDENHYVLVTADI